MLLKPKLIFKPIVLIKLQLFLLDLHICCEDIHVPAPSKQEFLSLGMCGQRVDHTTIVTCKNTYFGYHKVMLA